MLGEASGAWDFMSILSIGTVTSSCIFRHSAPPSDLTKGNHQLLCRNTFISDGLTVPIERIHPREVLFAALAGIRANVEVQLLVSLTVVLPGEALATPWPLALEGLLLRVRAQVS